jgi:hypothetical protein
VIVSIVVILISLALLAYWLVHAWSLVRGSSSPLAAEGPDQEAAAKPSLESLLRHVERFASGR